EDFPVTSLWCYRLGRSKYELFDLLWSWSRDGNWGCSEHPRTLYVAGGGSATIKENYSDFPRCGLCEPFRWASSHNSDPSSLVPFSIGDCRVQRSLALSITSIHGLLGIVGNPLLLSDQVLSSLSDFLGRIRHGASFLGLSFGRLRQGSSILGATVHLPPLGANEKSGEDGDANSNASPTDSRPLKTGHPLFNFLELLCSGGLWCWSVEPLG